MEVVEKYSDIPISKLSEERDPKKEQHLLDRMERYDYQAIQDAYKYAIDVIKGRWPEAEPFIKRYPQVSYYYAHYILDARWPEAESEIMKSPKYAYWYALHVIKDRWPEAEPAILRDPEKASAYTENVIGGRWPEAEEAFKEDPDAWEEYLYALKNLGIDMDTWQMEEWK